MTRTTGLQVALALGLVTAACGGGGEIAAMPVADAGFNRRGVQLGTVITLDGSASNDPDGATLTYDWELLSRPDASIAVLTVGADPVRPTLQPDVPGTYLVSLQVDNGQRTSRVDVVAIEARNEAPVAVATCECPPPGLPSCAVGICPGLHGTAVDLIGNDSIDPEGVNLTYDWQQLTSQTACDAACPGFASCNPQTAGQTLGTSLITLTNRQQQSASVVLPDVRDVHFVFALEVSDGFVSDTACVSYLTTNTPPSFFGPARESNDDYAHDEGETFSVECTPDTDDDGDSITILWRQIQPSAPLAILSAPTQQSTNVTVAAGSISSDTLFYFEVEISDGVDSATQQVPAISIANVP